MKIQVFGSGCKRCDDLYANVVEAVGRVPGVATTTTIEKVKDPANFIRMNVSVTPALVIEEEVVSSGKVLTPEQIEAELRKHITGEGQ